MAATGSRWYRMNLWLHRWCSLVATLPFLILCLTGTVLIFHEEIDAAMGLVPDAAEVHPEDALLQAAVDNVLALHPGERIASLSIEPDDHPGLALLVTVPNDAQGFVDMTVRFAELATGLPTEHASDPSATLTGFLLELHAQWFLGVAGELIGALVALLVLVSLVSGLVVYAPYARKVAFGLLRRGRGPRLRQLDLHNWIGVVVLGWALAVSATGLLLGFGTLATGLWSQSALGGLREIEGAAVDARHPPVGVDDAAAAVLRAAPEDWSVGTVIFPGTEYSTPGHYTLLAVGPEGLEERLFRAGVVDAASGELVALEEMPGYMKAIMLSQPLHFGDYGGLPLKLLWTACTWLTLFITGNGAWLWWDRRRRAPVRRGVRAAGAEALP